MAQDYRRGGDLRGKKYVKLPQTQQLRRGEERQREDYRQTRRRDTILRGGKFQVTNVFISANTNVEERKIKRETRKRKAHRTGIEGNTTNRVDEDWYRWKLKNG